MIQENDIREKIAEALRRDISLSDFALWIRSNSWNMHQDSSSDAVDLVSDIYLLLDERDDFSLSDSSLLNELSRLSKALDTEVAQINHAEPQVAYVFRPLSPSYRDLPFLSVQL